MSLKRFPTMISVALAVTSVSAESTYQMRYKVSGLQKQEAWLASPAGEGFWMLTGVNLDGLYPGFGDSSSTGTGSAQFNFGQNPFQGDPLAFSPYDPEYDSSLWAGATLSSDGSIVPSNLNNGRYLKTYTTGKYYFEATMTTSSWADALGFIPDTSGSFGSLNGAVGITYIGTYKSYIESTLNNLRTRWSATYNVVAGDTVQVWADFDNDRLLIKKLGTSADDHVDPITTN